MPSIHIRQEGSEVIVLNQHGELLLRMPWDAARDMARALRTQANRAEQFAKHEIVLADRDFLLQTGAPRSIAEAFMPTKASHIVAPNGVHSGAQFGKL